jgi:hypothetical protein
MQETARFGQEELKFSNPKSTVGVLTIIPETNSGAQCACLACGDFDFGAWKTPDAVT